MDGGMDVPGGSVPAGPQGSDGGRHEHSGSLPGVRSAPGRSAQDDRLLDPHLVVQLEVRQSLEEVVTEARDCFGVDLDREVHRRFLG